MIPKAEFHRSSRRSSVRILLLEDDADFAELVRRNLDAVAWADLSLERVRTLREALSRLAQGGIDLVLTDLNLPDSKGIETLESLVRAGDRLIIVLTGVDDPTLHDAAITRGAYDLVNKDQLDRVGLERLVRLASMQAARYRSLQESEHRAHLTLDTAPDAFVATDGAGAITDWNSRAEQLFGWSRQEVVGRSLAETIIPPRYREAHVRGLKHFLATGEVSVLNKTIQMAALRRDGDEIPVELSVWLVRSGDNCVFTAFLHDISKGKLAEQGLAFKTAVLRDTLENMDQGISMVDSELRVVAWNRRFLELLDFPEALFNEQTTFADVIRFNARRGEYGPGDVEEQVRQRVELARRFEPHVFERKRLDGTILEIRGNPLPGGGFVTTYTDVSARRRGEQAVRESEARFRSLTELSSDWYWEQDENFRFVEFSAGADLHDKSSAHVGRTRWELPGVDGSEKRWAEHRETLAAHKAFRNFEFQRLTEGGEVIWISASGEPIFDEQGVFKGYRGVGSDITVRKLADEALREQTERLQIGQKAAQMIILDRDIPNDRLTWSDSPEWLRGPLPPSGQYPLFKDQVHPEDREKFLATRAVAIESLQGQTQEFRIVRTDGQVVWLLTRQKVFSDASGKARRMLVALFDITERKVAERALGESEERFRALTELSSDLYWETDAEHRIIQFVYGAKIAPLVPAKELVGRRRWEIPAVIPDEEGWRAHRATLDAHMPFRDFELARRGGDGEVRYFSLSGEPVFDAGEVFAGYRGVGREITEQKKAASRLDQLAHFDPLTGLPNRALFQDRMHQAMARADRGQTLLAVMFLDLDRFKEINDSLGHTAGDEVLKEAARRLQSCLRATDTVGRLGGDEFTVLLEDVRHVDEISALAKKILDAFAEVAEVAGHEVHFSTSIGITVYPLDDRSADALLKNADIAMYQVKQEGRNNFQFFAVEMGARTERWADLRLRLHRALERGEFALHYQPQVGLAGGGIFGVEALLRWTDAELGPVSPAQFIPVAEEMGLIVPIGEWVLRESCRQCKSWLDAGLGPMRVAVNLSPRQFRQKKLARQIGEILRETGLPAACLEIEITEGIVMKHAERAITTLTELNRLGVQIAIDDFGTGYSSLGYLQRFPVHVLKIDQSFVQAIRGGTNQAAIVNTVIQLAKLLGLKALAEGVETVEQREYLRAHDCDAFQGYLFCKPQPAERIGELLAAHRRERASALR